MSDLLTTTDQPITRQAIEARGRSAPLKVTGKLKVALDTMVWEGLKRPDAAAKAGLSDHGVREALRRPHVKAYYLSQLEVLRTSERARNIHALVEVRDDPANKMARVQAVRTLENLSDAAESHAGSAQLRSPGVVIVVAPGATVNEIKQIDVNPRSGAESEDGA